MYKDRYSARLKCPYCEEYAQNHQDLKVHIGKQHKEKTDEFMETYLGGRWIEVDFISLMLRKALGKISKEQCTECGGCDVPCPISLTNLGFHPYDISIKLLEGKEREVLKSNIIWSCTTCYACGQNCKVGMPPYEVIETLMNLSSRIGYHVPRKYKEYDKSIMRRGVIQRSNALDMAEILKFMRKDIEIPDLPAQPDLKFKAALEKLAQLRGS